MRSAEAILDQLSEILVAEMPAQVHLLSQLEPTITLPDIQEVYIEEYDYDQLSSAPAILLFKQEPELLDSSGYILFDLPIDIVVWDIASGTGMSELHRKLMRYVRGVVEVMLGYHVTEAGFWEGVRLTAYLAGPPMELAGRYGRAKGVRFTFRVSESYY